MPEPKPEPNLTDAVIPTVKNTIGDSQIKFLIDSGLIPVPKIASKSGEAYPNPYSIEALVKNGLINKDVADIILQKDIEHIILRRSSDKQPGDPPANICIHSDCSVSGKNKCSNIDGTFVIEVDDTKEPKCLTPNQTSVLSAITITLAEVNPKALGDAPTDLANDIHHAKDYWIIPELNKQQTDAHTDNKEFIKSCADAVSSFEGYHTSINWRDSNGYPSFGRAQWNQQGGLTHLMESCFAADKDLFANIFHKAYLEQDRQQSIFLDTHIDHAKDICKLFASHNHKAISQFIHSAHITMNSPLGMAMKELLATKKFKAVQDRLLNERIVDAIKLSNEYGHNSQLFVALVADMTNQLGPAGVRKCLDKANVKELDEYAAVLTLQYAGEKVSRYRHARDQKLAQLFSRDKSAEQQA